VSIFEFLKSRKLIYLFLQDNIVIAMDNGLFLSISSATLAWTANTGYKKFFRQIEAFQLVNRDAKHANSSLRISAV
jgi:hypothetical protein